MKYLSLTLMLFTLCTGIATIAYTATTPFTEDILLHCNSFETIYIDDTLDVNARALPTNSTSAFLTWTSSDESIATIDSNPYSSSTKNNDVIIYPHALGRVTITVTTENGISKSFQLEVIPRPVTQVTMTTDCPYTTILTGSEYSFTATVTPSNATYKTLTWTSSDENVITVDQNGNFKAVGEGTATITASAHNGKSASKTFTVKDEIPVETITITNTGNLTLDSTRNLTYKVTPGNASVIDVTWTSSNEDIISITQDGKITALAVGSSTITVTNVNGKTYSATITVPRVEAETFRISTPSLKMSIGDTMQLSYTIYPSNVTDPIVWSSSNSDIISVDQNGLVTAHAETTNGVTIRATCGDKSSTIILFCYDTV